MLKLLKGQVWKKWAGTETVVRGWVTQYYSNKARIKSVTVARSEPRQTSGRELLAKQLTAFIH